MVSCVRQQVPLSKEVERGSTIFWSRSQHMGGAYLRTVHTPPNPCFFFLGTDFSIRREANSSGVSMRHLPFHACSFVGKRRVQDCSEPRGESARDLVSGGGQVRRRRSAFGGWRTCVRCGRAGKPHGGPQSGAGLRIRLARACHQPKRGPPRPTPHSWSWPWGTRDGERG
jgi:hypothetical protein